MYLRRVTTRVVTLLIIGAMPAVAFGQQIAADALIPNCGDGVVDLGEQCDGSADAACPGMCTARCACPPATTVNIPSAAEPPNTPGSPGVIVTNANLLTQFGPQANLNNARYTRFALDDSGAQPDAILILIPGFEGGAANFRILAQNLLKRAKADHNLRLEVWAFDRRTNQLEDTEGLDIAEAAFDPILAGNWLFGDELSLPLDPRLPRRAVFYNAHDDVPFLANWTNLVFSRDIDAVVDAALAVARNKNVFLGGHSAGTGFTARYAATDFDTAPGCAGPVEAGYAKLRGLALLEGRGRIDVRRECDHGRYDRSHHRPLRRRPLRRGARQCAALRRWGHPMHGEHRGHRLCRTDATEVYAADDGVFARPGRAEPARARVIGSHGAAESL